MVDRATPEPSRQRFNRTHRVFVTEAARDVQVQTGPTPRTCYNELGHPPHGIAGEVADRNTEIPPQTHRRQQRPFGKEVVKPEEPEPPEPPVGLRRQAAPRRCPYAGQQGLDPDVRIHHGAVLDLELAAVNAGAVPLALEPIGHQHLPRVPLDRIRILGKRGAVVVDIAVVDLSHEGIRAQEGQQTRPQGGKQHAAHPQSSQSLRETRRPRELAVATTR